MTPRRRLFPRQMPSFDRLPNGSMSGNLSDPVIEPKTTDAGSRVTLRKLSLIACLIGGAGSIGLFLLVSQQAPILIILLFVAWLVAPFAGLLLAHVYSSRWSRLTQTTLYCVTLFVTLVSLIIYGYQVIWPRQSTPAFYWVAVPPASALLAIAVISIAGIISRRSRPT